ncbi:MAG TPA: nitroreductase family protein [Candidatus Polarisedimenticolia bacterium]|nr:nitroreductase family protein [Candidatus Polarisedimenticolia bacterium]
MEKPAPTPVPIHPLLARRWSARALDPDRMVEPEKLDALLEAARWAPSSNNDQPWNYLVFDGSDPEALEQARSCLVEGNAWARKAPLLLLSVAREHFIHKGKPNRHAQHDVGLASENLVLQGTEMGLVTHQMAGFDADKARRLFGIPEGNTPMAMIALGYPGKIEALPDPLQERERGTRTRKAVEEWAFQGKWGNGRKR